MWSLSEAVARAGGSLEGEDCTFVSVGTDSRVDCAGQLFVALRGERFDGHDHVAAARAAGAVAAMVDHPLPVDLPQWIVEDTRAGLGALAAAWRDVFPGRVAAITGSNGKTTVKEMLAAILEQAGRVRATRGNLNNDIGMPLTLLSARDEDFLVLEMGANHHGEIGYMTDIARPDVALITNAGRAHLEGFGSVDGVAHAKGEIARGLPADGVFVFAGDSPYAGLWNALAAGRRTLTFGLEGSEGFPADLRADRSAIRGEWTETGFSTHVVAHHEGRAIPIALRLAGEHNARNALAAAATALALGIEPGAIQAGLATLMPVKGRLCPRRCGGVGVIDDTYNANPDSIAAAIQVLAGLSGRRWLILGDLAELGSEADALHREVGEIAREAGIERLFSVGILSESATSAFGDCARHFADQGDLVRALRSELSAGDRLLVKGSRSARMEQVVEALCAEGES
ncbi:UDP-N-acetylmuramoyl-tripeptide--D-alanyl-D-alanine ligase [Thiocapsa marina]|uniref:UDP-N-acetylmuramoyl-tripeptide--D-alanyl-D-alanine ligase n=1 Tax=Thiocapsa marina 5811 TaxID=768671 RepID=F9U8G0_9GAMM|nr:UDP-N-acetylmuramoyl-tripeptide--D-alanyl-D-alanine ligase [Thiocapsa marina]EGV19572.1 UDP-N-acetylmuramoylalanyl-D-glutamyl-2,6-diaminopimelate/D-alanyl-D-alanyl ligase [Thiocapsa marina 5811]